MLLEKWNQLGTFYQFVVKAVLLYLIWVFFDRNIMAVYPGVNGELTDWIAQHSAMVLNWIGFDAHAARDLHVNYVYVGGRKLVHIESGCNGLILMWLFLSFIIAYPGKLVQKLWFIPFGVVLIHIANVGRIVFLTTLLVNDPQSVDFHHKYTFQITVYLIIFMLWVWWANVFSKQVEEQGGNGGTPAVSA